MKRNHTHPLSSLLLALVLMAGLAAPVLAGGGWLDPTFDEDGIVYTDFGAYSDEARDLVIQPDGKIVAVGIGGSNEHFPPYGFGVARYLPNGALDPEFSDDGKALIYPTGYGDRAYAVVMQPDGAFLVGGQANAEFGDFALIRLRPDGSLDKTFGGDGIVMTGLGRPDDVIMDLALQPDGRIVAVGRTRTGDDADVALTRYNTDGTLDASFSDDGIEVTQVGTDQMAGARVTLLPDGKILALAQRNGAPPTMILLRYNADGSLDTTFDGDGIAIPDIGPKGGIPNDIMVLPNGKILLAGTFGMGDAFGIARVNADGTIDRTFGVDGRALTPQYVNGVTAMARQPDGGILLAGRHYAGADTTFSVTRFRASGNLDTRFGAGGVMVASVGIQPVPHAMALDAEGKIVLGGAQYQGSISSDFTLVRFTPPLIVMRPTWAPMVMR